MANAKGYRLRISRNPYFSSTIVDRRVNTADVLVSGLTGRVLLAGAVRRTPPGKQSVESEKNRFTIIPKGQDNDAIGLDLDPLIQHGHVLELTGKTEPGARVMVNGPEVPLIGGRRQLSLLHAAPADRGERDHGHGAERQGRRQHPAEESGDSVVGAGQVETPRGAGTFVAEAESGILIELRDSAPITGNNRWQNRDKTEF